jgi:anaerobic nitric oxide reductase transcription regulator
MRAIPKLFDDLDMKLIAMLGALAGAAMRTTTLIEALRSAPITKGVWRGKVVRTVAQAQGEILGTGSRAVRLREEIAMVASSDLAVLITARRESAKSSSRGISTRCRRERTKR